MNINIEHNNTRLIDLVQGHGRLYTIIRVISPHSSTHTARTTPVEQSIVFQLPPITMDHIESFLDVSKYQKDSQFLENYPNPQITYSTEADILIKIQEYVKDLLKLMGLHLTVQITVASALMGKYCDLYLVSIRGVPFMVIEIKSPRDFNQIHLPSKLDNLKVQGQLFDYMMNIRSMYGQQNVIGVLTDLHEWKLCCFEHDVDFITSLNQNPTLHNNRLINNDIINRVLCVSQALNLNDNSLGKWLVLSIKKCMNATHIPMVDILSPDRCILHYKAGKFTWETLKQEYVRIHLSLPRNEPLQSFAILRFFHRGADGSVALAITTKGSLCVLKYHFQATDRQKEIDLWKRLYDVDCFPVAVDRNNTNMVAMVMPFALHAEYSNGAVQFNFNVSAWATEGGAVQTQPCRVLDELTTELTTLWTSMNTTPEAVAIDAMKNMINAKLVHRDLKWSHVALLRIHDITTNSPKFKPILLDLVNVEEEASVEAADRAMREEAATSLGITW